MSYGFNGLLSAYMNCRRATTHDERFTNTSAIRLTMIEKLIEWIDITDIHLGQAHTHTYTTSNHTWHSQAHCNQDLRLGITRLYFNGVWKGVLCMFYPTGVDVGWASRTIHKHNVFVYSLTNTSHTQNKNQPKKTWQIIHVGFVDHILVELVMMRTDKRRRKGGYCVKNRGWFD